MPVPPGTTTGSWRARTPPTPRCGAPPDDLLTGLLTAEHEGRRFTRRRHLSSGVGRYLCPGAALARREARISLKLLGGRLPGLRLAGEPTRVDSFMMWGPSALPIAWSA
ncbi:hypothetical protein [Actinomadura sp. 3N407]|uniref:hypothetical protein n=1 Tax=Actinomadura sp. 3N407 TaxID=3457423 RepID=UPI003FCD773D